MPHQRVREKKLNLRNISPEQYIKFMISVQKSALKVRKRPKQKTKLEIGRTIKITIKTLKRREVKEKEKGNKKRFINFREILNKIKAKRASRVARSRQ